MWISCENIWTAPALFIYSWENRWQLAALAPCEAGAEIVTVTGWWDFTTSPENRGPAPRDPIMSPACILGHQKLNKRQIVFSKPPFHRYAKQFERGETWVERNNFPNWCTEISFCFWRCWLESETQPASASLLTAESRSCLTNWDEIT